MRWPLFGRDESAKRMARYDVRTTELTALRRHLPAMRTTADELAHGVAHLQVLTGTAALQQSVYGVTALSDLHTAAISDLEQGRDFGAMVLAKEGIRLAVDATYVFCDPEGSRLEALIRHQLDAERERLAHWKRAFPEDTQPGPCLRRLDDLCRRSPWYAQAPEWPSFVARAEAVGLDSWIHPIFSAASGASEAATRQFINAVEREQLPESEHAAASRYRTARDLSDTLYVEAVALLLFAHVLHQLSVNVGDAVAVTVAECAKERMESLLAEHDALAEAHANDRNVYFALRSAGG